MFIAAGRYVRLEESEGEDLESHTDIDIKTGMTKPPTLVFFEI